MEQQYIKVKIRGTYRRCLLRGTYNSKATGKLGYVDVELYWHDQPWGTQKDWKHIPIRLVRKADLPFIEAYHAQKG